MVDASSPYRPFLVAFCAVVSVLCCSLASITAAEAASSDLTLTSSSRYLVDAFNWNKSKVLSWVRTGAKPGYIPCYWAGYNYREAFYVRDIAHQCEGAALLGLNNENLSMWRAFAGTANASRQWFCLWALDFSGKIYPVDYRGDNDFVREIPAPLELVDRAYTCYRWSADSRWIADPVLTRFYKTTMNEFIGVHDDNKDGIAEGHFVDIFEGACGSYCEQSEGGYGVGGDNIATTWSAYNSYAALLAAMGKTSETGAYRAKANRIRDCYKNNWWNSSGKCYYGGRTIGLGGWITAFDQFSKEAYVFQALKCIAEPGSRANSLLDVVDASYRANRANYNFESFTYLPESFYHYNQNDRGWYWLKCILDSRYEYPEVSFTAIGSIATGMMGIRPDAPKHRISTLGHLTSAVEWVQLDHIPIGTHDVLVRHGDANGTTTVRNNTGKTDLVWEAQFPGTYPKLYVGGVARKAGRKPINGAVVSYVTVTVAGGQAQTVSTAPPRNS